MAETNVTSAPFLSATSTSPSRSSDRRGQTEAKNSSNEEFSKSLDSASSAPVRSVKPGSSKPTSAKMDKPKNGNRDPFFPATPMPYHPDVQTSDASENYSTSGIEHADEVHFNGRPGFANRINPNRGQIEEVEGLNEEDVSSPEAKFDDHIGVMNKSYDSTAVSYPVSRIASESLDENASDDLRAKGLWDAPTYMAAVPTQKTMAMAQMVEMQSESNAVPVQRPIAKFMASLESELGVSHDRLVGAFQSLPQGSLSQPPRETMMKVVQNLGLTGEDETKAIQIYSKMLSQMEALDPKDQMMPVDSKLMAAATAGVGASESALSRKVNGDSAEVRTPATSTPGSQTQSHASAQVKMATGKYAAQASDKFVEKVNGSEAKASVVAPAAGSINEESSEQQPQFQQQSQSQGQNNFVNGLAKQEKPMQNLVTNKLATEIKTETKAHSATDALMNSQTPLAGHDQAMLPQDAKILGAASGAAAGQSASSASGHVNNETKQEAIQAIVNNAKLLAQNGGGEMHMTLKPEHLGEIHLRVAMDGQKLDVQMTTERADVKKLIEQSVHELKHGLAGHNLNMEKLDVSLNNKNADDFQQPSRDFSQAREFAQQFHSQNQARRELADLEMPGGARLNNNSLGSRAESASKMMASQARGSRMSSSGRLNVIA
jgi:flagellar hook-length control protein FliK